MLEMEPFAIEYSWRKLEKPRQFREEAFLDIDPLGLAMEKFLATHDGEFQLKIGSNRLAFDLKPDLGTIFEDLPDVLEGLRLPGSSELHFYEQGTDLTLDLQPSDGALAIRFKKGLSAARRFSQLPEEPVVVDRAAFTSEWVRFMLAILDAVADAIPNVKDDRSYDEYRDRLQALA